jgi:hypothetical protein
MLDLTGILFSTVLMLFVILRAVQLDRLLPWFQTIGRPNLSRDPHPEARKPSKPAGTAKAGTANAGMPKRTTPKTPWRRD